MLTIFGIIAVILFIIYKEDSNTVNDYPID